jgi:signal transduction histidine kinase
VGEFSNAVESFTARDGLTDDYAHPVLQDVEGNIWVGTSNGLDRFRKSSFVPIAPSVIDPSSILAAGDAGNVWACRQEKLTSIDGVHVNSIKTPIARCRSGYRSIDGANWWIGNNGVYRVQDNRVSRYPLPHGVGELSQTVVVAGDESGVLWAAVEGQGFYFMRKGMWHRYDTPEEVAGLEPLTSFTDRTGRIWIGYAGGEVVTLENGTIQFISSGSDSLVGSVKAIEGRYPHVWIGGERGLAFYDGGRFHLVVPAGQASFISISGVQETARGDLWLSGRQGALHITGTEVQHYLKDFSYRVKFEAFDSLDGLPGTFFGGATPLAGKSIQSTDGRLWFVASKGIAWMDPEKSTKNILPPPVAIESLSADGRHYTSWKDLILPPRTKSLQITYTALSLTLPERVRFLYFLEGLDRDWQDAGTRREAFYTNLGPGHYRFHVIACNNDGVWNESGAAVKFSILPLFYQTRMFQVICVTILIGLIWLGMRVRIRHVAANIRKGAEVRADERVRIARELHDTLLQSTQGLILLFQGFAGRLTRPDPMRDQIEGALDQADRLLNEARSRVADLRSKGTKGDFSEAIASLGGEIFSDATTGFHLTTIGASRALDPAVSSELYLIIREALTNARRHAQASVVEAEIEYGPSGLRVQIRDDGKGVDESLLRDGAHSGHFGLQGMRERARQIGASFDIWSGRSAGIVIEVTIPAGTAYWSGEPRRSWIRIFGARKIK